MNRRPMGLGDTTEMSARFRISKAVASRYSWYHALSNNVVG
jgi:hypothetical protein